MSLLLWNLILAIFWVALSNDLSPLNFLFGFSIGFLVLFLARGALGQTNYFWKTYTSISFLFFFIVEIVKSALRVALDVVTPRHRMRPGVIAIPLDASTDLEITLLANLISLTPGTLSLDVSDDRRTLFIHSMYIDEDDIEGFRSHVKDSLERRILELLR